VRTLTYAHRRVFACTVSLLEEEEEAREEEGEEEGEKEGIREG